MRKLIYLLSILSCSSCTHNVPTKIFRTVSKTGSIIQLTNYKDTLVLGDTLGLEFYLPNPIKLDDGSTIKIKNITNTGIGYQFNKSYDSVTKNFYFYPKVVEKEKSYLSGDGRFLFKPLLMPLLGTVIHYVPQDTGTYIISTERFQNLVCDIEGSTDQVQINFFPDFNVPNKNLYLLDPFPTSKIGYDYGKANYAVPYCCFYVKHK